MTPRFETNGVEDDWPTLQSPVQRARGHSSESDIGDTRFVGVALRLFESFRAKHAIIFGLFAGQRRRQAVFTGFFQDPNRRPLGRSLARNLAVCP